MTYLSSWVSWRYPMSASPDLPVEEAGSVATPHLFGDGVALTLPNRAYKQLTALYAAVRNAYADKVGFVADLAYKTRRLIEGSAEQQGLGRLTKSVTFDVHTLQSLRRDGGSAAAQGPGRAHPQGFGGAQDHRPGRDG